MTRFEDRHCAGLRNDDVAGTQARRGRRRVRNNGRDHRAATRVKIPRAAVSTVRWQVVDQGHLDPEKARSGFLGHLLLEFPHFFSGGEFSMAS